MANEPQMVDGSPSNACRGCRPGCILPLLQDQPSLVFAALIALILSFGVVACVFEFIWLCFLYPTAANVLIPLILVPLAIEAKRNGKQALDAISAHRASSTASGGTTPSEPSVIQLGVDKKVSRGNEPGK